MERIGVLLLHRGEASTPQEAGAFLRAFYSDPSVYPLPLWSEAQKLAARLRARLEEKEYAKEVLDAGGRSPLHTSADALAARVEDALNGELQGTAAACFRTKMAFRYCRPSIAEGLAALRAEGVARLVGVTLYPQLCPTFLGSSVAELSRAADEAGLRLSVIDRYAEHPAYLDSLERSIAQTLARFEADERDGVTLLFSALGLEESAVSEGDPYPTQLEATVKALCRDKPNPHRLAFHGKDSLGPSTAQVLLGLAKGKAAGVAVVPLGSVVDQVSTVSRLDVQLGKLGKEAGVGRLERSAALSLDPKFAEALATLVKEHLAKQAALGMGM